MFYFGFNYVIFSPCVMITWRSEVEGSIVLYQLLAGVGNAGYLSMKIIQILFFLSAINARQYAEIMSHRVPLESLSGASQKVFEDFEAWKKFEKWQSSGKFCKIWFWKRSFSISNTLLHLGILRLNSYALLDIGVDILWIWIVYFLKVTFIVNSST